MARDVTVVFDDGSQHVYRGAPDDITPQQVQERAEKEFRKPVTSMDGGRKAAPVAPAPTLPPTEPVAKPEGAPLLQRMLGETVGKPADTMLGGVLDVPLQVASGVAGGVEMIANLFGANSKVSTAMRDTQGYLSGLLSASAKQDQKEIARILEDAKDKGVLDQVQAGLKAFTVAPVDMMSQAFGTMAPVIATGAAAALAQVPVVAAGAVSAGVGAAMGAGTVKGSIYQATQDILKERTQLSDKQIDKIAEQAQAYGGKNLDQILIGAGLGAFGARTGVESVFAKNLAKGITSKAAALEAIEAANKKETEAMVKAGVKKTAAKKGAAEFAGEAAEGGQEQMAANIAQQREGYTDVPTMRGVVSQATMEGMAGLGLGAYGGGREAYKARQRAAAPLTEEEKKFMEPGDVKKREEAIQKAGSISDAITAALQSSTVATPEQIAALTKQGAQNVEPTDESAAGASASVAGESTTTTGEPAGTDVGGVDAAGTTAGTTDAGKKTKPTALTPADLSALTDEQLQDKITENATFGGDDAEFELLKQERDRRSAATLQPKLEALSKHRNDLVDMIDDGLPVKHGKVKNKLKALNNLEQELGLKLSTYDEVSFDTTPPGGGVLSAKKQAPKYVVIKDLIKKLEGEGKQVPDNLRVVAAADTHPAFKIDPNATEEENLRGAMELSAARDKIEAEEAEATLKESKVNRKGEPKGEVRYDQDNLPDYAEEMYNDVREDKPDLPEWYKLKIDEKDVFFDKIRRNTLDEYYKAADALIAHRKEKGSRAEGYKKAQEKAEKFEGPPTKTQKEKLEVSDRTSTPAGQRTILNYNENREIASGLLGIKFPRWGDLPVGAQKAYLNAIINNATKQMDVAFAAAAEQMVKEKSGITEQQRQATIDNVRRLQDKVRIEAEKNQAELERINREYERSAGTEAFVPGKAATKLSKSVVEHLKNGRLKMALEEIAENLSKNPDPQNKLAGQVAKRLAELGLNTKVRISTKPLSNNDLAQYDPVRDEIVIGPEGFSTSTVLHEVTHAGTVRVLYLYLSGKRNLLSERQIKGAEQIMKIMLATKDTLGKRFPNAYDFDYNIDENGDLQVNTDGEPNVYEFIAYAMNDKAFQAALEEASIGYSEGILMDTALKDMGKKPIYGTQPIESMLPDKKSAWSAFKKAIAGILNFAKTPFKNINFVMELNAAFDDILSVPTGGIRVDQTFSAKGKKAAAPKKENKEVEPEGYVAPGFLSEDPRYKTPAEIKPESRFKRVKNALTTKQGWLKTARALQNRRAFAKDAQNKAALSERLFRDLDTNFNNFYDQLVTSAAEAENFFNGRLLTPMDNLRMSVRDFASSMNVSIDRALEMLHPILEAFHEPERRFVKWMMTVPLSTQPTLLQNGKLISPAERREQIVGDMDKGKKGLIHEAALSDQQKAALRQELEFLTGGKLVKGKDGMFEFQKQGGFTDPKGGYTPVTDRKIKSDKFYDAHYNVLGIGQQQIKKVQDELKALSPEQRGAVDKVMANISEISKQAAKLEQIGKYWSFPVSNMTGIYDWQYYAPFKGKGKNDEVHHDAYDEIIDPHSKRNGREHQEVPQALDGRYSASNNPILQLLSDATRAAGRAGRRNLTEAVKNALPYDKEKNPNGTGIIEGAVVKTIPFFERATSLEEYKGKKYLLNYNDDGSVDVLFIKDQNIRDAISLSFQDANMLLDVANRITGFFGRMHTRYNIDFPMLNFVRDMLTNAWVIGAEKGALKSLKFIKEVATQVFVHNGMYKAMRVAALHDKGDAASIRELQKLQKNDPYVQDMLTYIREGGKTTYLSGFALRSQLEELDNSVGKNRIVTKMEDVGKLLDIWVNMFEFASRTAAFSLMRDDFRKRNEARNMDKETAAAEAQAEAVAYAKGLANFEEVGEYGRALGAIYMFIRPSATGAVRAIEAVAPAFRDVPGTKWAFGSVKDVVATLPEDIRNDEKAVAAFMENYREHQKNARAMVSILIGAGAAMFLLSAAGAGEDDEGRNSTLNDNMEQWTRYARFHLPNSVSEPLGLGKDVVFQMPWGFGPGAFMAIGAQIAAMGAGVTSMKEGMANITTALLDSYVPMPFSKMPISEMPLAWAIDSAMPTVVRPAVEFIMNKNGIGQDINSAATRRMADAFTGGDRIPELYKDVSAMLFDASAGETDVTPNTLYFFANSYLDGVGRIAQMMYNSGTKTEREFSPRLDVPTLGSFFGAKSNVDAREFGKVEKKIEEIDKKLATFDKGVSDADVAARYEENHPMHREFVKMYKQHRKQLDVLRKEANEIRADRTLEIRDRQDMLRDNIVLQNRIKREMLDQIKDYDPDF